MTLSLDALWNRGGSCRWNINCFFRLETCNECKEKSEKIKMFFVTCKVYDDKKNKGDALSLIIYMNLFSEIDVRI